MVEKIRVLFEKAGCPAVVIMQTSKAGEEVDNGCGLDFELVPYAVIHEGSDVNVLYDLIYGFERENNTGIMHFAESGCTSIEGLIEELNDRDGYEVKWRKTK